MVSRLGVAVNKRNIFALELNFIELTSRGKTTFGSLSFEFPPVAKPRFPHYQKPGLSDRHHGDKQIVRSSRLSELVDLYHGSHHQFPFEKDNECSSVQSYGGTASPAEYVLNSPVLNSPRVKDHGSTQAGNYG